MAKKSTIDEQIKDLMLNEGVEPEVKDEPTAQPEIKIDVTEDVNALITGEELTEEFKEKAKTIFEAAVVTRVKAEVEKISEELTKQAEIKQIALSEELVDKIDGYLNYVVEQWITQNEIALEHGIRTEITESFIGKLKNLFEESHISIPEGEFDVVKDLETKILTLEQKLDETVQSNISLTKQVNKNNKDVLIGQISEGLADTEKEKFKKLAEEIGFENTDQFKGKLQSIRESYFPAKPTVITETVEITDAPITEVVEQHIDPTMKKYVSMIGQSAPTR